MKEEILEIPPIINQDYTAPMWVGHNNSRFKYEKGGYLPALVQKCEDEQPKVQALPSDIDYQLNQLKGRLIHLENKVMEMRAKKRQTPKDSYLYNSIQKEE